MSLSTSASYYDGATSTCRAVEISMAGDGTLNIQGLEQPCSLSIDQLDIQPRVGNTPRNIYLPDGAKLEVADNDFVDRFAAQHKGHNTLHLIHILESRWHYVAVSMVVTIVFIWWFVTFGIPTMAKHVAYVIPASSDELIGKGSLQTMDRLFFTPSEIGENTQAKLRSMFHDMVEQANDSHSYRLEFRKSEAIGANAFALPSGIVVITDELIELAKNDEEIMSVLAHEIGHVVHRHSLRTVLQNSAVSLIVATIVGDVASISSVAATLPTVLVHSKYSREFETEADTYSFNFLRKNDIDTIHFANIMLRMDESHKPEDNNTTSYLSSHPATRDRIMRFKEASDHK